MSLLLLTPVGSLALNELLRWMQSFDAPVAFSLPTIPNSVSEWLSFSGHPRMQDIGWVVSLFGVALLGNAWLMQRQDKAADRTGTRQFTFCLLLPAIIVFTSSLPAVVLAQSASPMPPETFWKEVGDTLGPLRMLLFLLIGALAVCGITAAALLARIYLRRATEKLDRIVAARSGAYLFFIGLFNFIVLFAVAVVCGKPGPLKILTLVILLSLAALIFLGFTARVRSVGQALLELSEAQGSETQQVAAGGALLALIFLIPFAGQIFWAVVLVQSLGTGLLWLFRRFSPSVKADTPIPARPEN